MIALHLIETFILFGDTQNLVKTAKILNQSQPSASRQIEQFQKYFKKPLFHSVKRQKILTDYGQNVHHYYKKAVYDLRELQDGFASFSINNQQEKLTLAARPEILYKYVANLKYKCPMELVALSGDNIREQLLEDKLDMAVLQENFESYNHFRKKLFSTSWKIIIPKSWNITSYEKKPFAAYDKNLNYLQQNKNKKFEIPELNIHFIANDWRLLEAKVHQGQCWAIVPEEYGNRELVTSLSLSQLMNETQFYIYFKKELAKNKDVQYIVDQLS
ncbi:MAG: LysR family transcriptional regulator [Pseudobdellovibrio sp.]